MNFLYETVSGTPGTPPRRYELPQGPDEAPLTRHPETGEPIRRVILGGWGAGPGITRLTESGGNCCGTDGCC